MVCELEKTHHKFKLQHLNLDLRFFSNDCDVNVPDDGM